MKVKGSPQCDILRAAIVLITPSFKIVRVTMDLFQHRYYRLNKTLMTLIGQWPYQSTCARRILVVITILVSVSQGIPLILATVKYRDDTKILLDATLSILFVAFYLTKFIGLLCNSQTSLMLLNRIRTDWHVWARDREVKFLHEYAEQGKTLSAVYAAMIYSTLCVFMAQPVVSKIMKIVWMNRSEPGRFPFPVDYYNLDLQKYYYYIIMYSSICLCLFCTVVIANDIMLITHVQHGCGLFTALGQKLERMGYDAPVEIGVIPSTLSGRSKLHLASCIDRHNDAIEYANLIERANTWSFFFMIGFGMIQLIVSALRILMGNCDPDETIKFVMFACTITLVFMIYSYLCQILMDHSINIHFHLYNNQWYRLSVKAQKLLQLMTMRSHVPCQITAGRILIMSFSTVLLTARTALSYFTFVRSIQ